MTYILKNIHYEKLDYFDNTIIDKKEYNIYDDPLLCYIYDNILVEKVLDSFINNNYDFINKDNIHDIIDIYIHLGCIEGNICNIININIKCEIEQIVNNDIIYYKLYNFMNELEKNIHFMNCIMNYIFENEKDRVLINNIIETIIDDRIKNKKEIIIDRYEEGIFDRYENVKIIKFNDINYKFTSNMFPKTVTHIILGSGYNKKIEKDIFSNINNLEHFEFSDIYSHDIEPKTLPDTITYLRYCNIKIINDVIPNNLKELRFVNNYNFIIDNNVLPNSIQKIVFNNNFSKHINNNNLPDNLKILVLPYYNKKIYDTTFPISLEELYIEKYNKSLDADVFKNNINLFTINIRNYTNIIIPKSLPPKIQSLDIYDYHLRSDKYIDNNNSEYINKYYNNKDHNRKIFINTINSIYYDENRKLRYMDYDLYKYDPDDKIYYCNGKNKYMYKYENIFKYALSEILPKSLIELTIDTNNSKTYSYKNNKDCYYDYDGHNILQKYYYKITPECLNLPLLKRLTIKSYYHPLEKDIFSNLCSLEYLNLSSIKYELKSDHFKNITSLKHLVISDYHYNIDDDLFKHLINLEKIEFINCVININNISLKYLSSLQELSIINKNFYEFLSSNYLSIKKIDKYMYNVNDIIPDKGFLLKKNYDSNHDISNVESLIGEHEIVYYNKYDTDYNYNDCDKIRIDKIVPQSIKKIVIKNIFYDEDDDKKILLIGNTIPSLIELEVSNICYMIDMTDSNIERLNISDNISIYKKTELEKLKCLQFTIENNMSRNYTMDEYFKRNTYNMRNLKNLDKVNIRILRVIDKYYNYLNYGDNNMKTKIIDKLSEILNINMIVVPKTYIMNKRDYEDIIIMYE